MFEKMLVILCLSHFQFGDNSSGLWRHTDDKIVVLNIVQYSDGSFAITIISLFFWHTFFQLWFHCD